MAQIPADNKITQVITKQELEVQSNILKNKKKEYQTKLTFLNEKKLIIEDLISEFEKESFEKNIFDKLNGKLDSINYQIKKCIELYHDYEIGINVVQNLLNDKLIKIDYDPINEEIIQIEKEQENA